MSKILKYKAVLFDLDGTLLDTIEDLAGSMNAVLHKKGYPLHSVEDYKLFIGNGLRNLVTRALPQDKRDNSTVDSCFASMNSEYKLRWNKATKPYEGIPELLKELTASGLKLAVLSNKADEFTKIIIEHYFPAHRFIAVAGQKPDVPIKPDPAAALEIARSSGLEPSDFLYLGDSGVDMETANRAGMFPVGALWGFRSGEELKSKGAAVLISKPLKLLDYVR